MKSINEYLINKQTKETQKTDYEIELERMKFLQYIKEEGGDFEEILQHFVAGYHKYKIFVPGGDKYTCIYLPVKTRPAEWEEIFYLGSFDSMTKYDSDFSVISMCFFKNDKLANSFIQTRLFDVNTKFDGFRQTEQNAKILMEQIKTLSK